MNRIILAGDGNVSACDIDKTGCIIVIIFRMESVICRINGKRSVRDADRIICLKTLVCGGNDIGSAGDLQVILGGNAVVCGADGQGAGTVECYIIFGEDDRIGIGVSVCGKCSAYGQCIVTAGCGCDKYLVRILHIDARAVCVGDGYPVQHDLHFRIICRINRYSDILCGALQNIDTFLGDTDVLAVFHGHGLCVCKIRGLFHVAVGEVFPAFCNSIAGCLHRSAAFRGCGLLHCRFFDLGAAVCFCICGRICACDIHCHQRHKNQYSEFFHSCLFHIQILPAVSSA